MPCPPSTRHVWLIAAFPHNAATGLLIMPVQRVPRHKLLLRELLKHTPESHPDYAPCSAALVKISESAMQASDPPPSLPSPLVARDTHTGLVRAW